MLKLPASLLLIALCQPAWAIYKCELNGKISYRDTPCESGKALSMQTPIESKVSAVDAEVAAQRAERDREQLSQIEAEHERAELRAQKIRHAAAKADATQKKKCAKLAQKKQWLEDDAAAANMKSREKAKRAARRKADEYELECKT
jgi:hypothetical protein